MRIIKTIMSGNKFKLKINKTVSGFRLPVLLFLLVLLSLGSACGNADDRDVTVKTSAPTPESKPDELKDALFSMEAGGFDYVFIFHRTDGEPLTADDKKYLKDNAPADTNRWNLTSDGKIAVAGSNYKFTAENLKALEKRFVIENRSKVKEEANSNTASAANTNTSKK